MATVAHTVGAIARGFNIPASIVRQNARNLREAGIFPTSPDSRPIELSTEQIVLILLASLVPCLAKDAAAVARRYGALLAGEESLADALVDTLNGNSCDRLVINLDEPGATLSRAGGTVVFGSAADAPVHRTVSVSGAAFQNLAAALRGAPPAKRRRRRH